MSSWTAQLDSGVRDEIVQDKKKPEEQELWRSWFYVMDMQDHSDEKKSFFKLVVN